jgi:hypothetical protein
MLLTLQLCPFAVHAYYICDRYEQPLVLLVYSTTQRIGISGDLVV